MGAANGNAVTVEETALPVGVVGVAAGIEDVHHKVVFVGLSGTVGHAFGVREKGTAVDKFEAGRGGSGVGEGFKGGVGGGWREGTEVLLDFGGGGG